MGESSWIYIAVVLEITPCNPAPPIKTAFGLTLKLPPFVLLDVHAKKLPLSNPSAKIRSDTADVGVTVRVSVGVLVGPGVFVGVKVGVGVDVFVGVGDGPTVDVDVAVKVAVGVKVGVAVKVAVGALAAVAVGKVPETNTSKASTSLAS